MSKTSIKESPVLPAKTLASACYREMLNNNSNLVKITIHATDISSAQYCLTAWVSSVGSTGKFYCPQELNITTGGNGIPSGWIRYNLDGTLWEDPNAE